jgi:putative copper resistance protein D
VDPNNKPVSFPFRLILLIATMAFHAFFGLGLMNESGLLLSDWYGAMGREWGLDPLADQQAGGAIAWGIGELPTIVLTLLVVTQWARSDERERRRIDRAAARTGDEELENYNDMLARLAQREGDTRN